MTDPWSAWPAPAAFLLAIGTGWCLVRVVGAPQEQGRYASIDGLRGYLAFSVFLHHSVVWSNYLRSGEWKVPEAHLYAHFGQGSVALFFMITAFLFGTKLLDARRGRPVDWLRLYVSRVLRLAPLYVALILTTFVFVGVLSHWQLESPVGVLVKRMLRWMSFMILDVRDLNGVEHTGRIGGGVAWSLAYEWFFYFSLPLIALLLGMRAPRPCLLFSLLAMSYALAVFKPEMHRTGSFAGGLLAALLVRSDRFRRFARSGLATVMVLACLVAAVAFYREAYAWRPLLLYATAFALIAGGNSVLGLLTHPVSCTLGELAYSIYLLHALLLFFLLRFVIGMERASAWPAQNHWLLALAATPVLLCTAMFTFRWIEQPAMRYTSMCTAWLRSRPWAARPAAPGKIG